MFSVYRWLVVPLLAGSVFVLLGLHALVPISGFAMDVGFAESDITPSVGMERPGGYIKNFHKEVHDPCKVRAAVFGDGNSRVALVGIDALLIRAPIVRAARERIAKQCGIAENAILIGASHSHSAGPMGMILPGEYAHASPLIQHLAYAESSLANTDYLQRVEDALVEAVCQANQRCETLVCGIGRGLAEGVTFNRRFRMRSGLTQTNPRQGNPETIEPAGPIDPEVGVLGAWNKSGKLVGCVVNFACHCTTSPGGISADYVFYIEQAIRGMFGHEVIVVFLNGASGDVTQINNLSPYVLPTREQSARLVGGTIGAEAIKVLVSMTPGDLGSVAARQSVLRIPRRVPRPERVQEAFDIVRDGKSQHTASVWTFAKELVVLEARIQASPVADVEVQAVQVGPAVFLANPAEYFCQYGLDIKAKSNFPFTFPVSLANDCVGYVPTEEALSPTGGGYETRLTSYSNLVPTAGTQIADACLALAKELIPGTIPRPAAAPVYRGNEWDYGNLPPQLD